MERVKTLAARAVTAPRVTPIAGRRSSIWPSDEFSLSHDRVQPSGERRSLDDSDPLEREAPVDHGEPESLRHGCACGRQPACDRQASGPDQQV